MRTTHFILNYLGLKAKVTICNTSGSIIYCGELGEMPIKLIRGTIINRIDGLGSQNDIIIEVSQA